MQIIANNNHSGTKSISYIRKINCSLIKSSLRTIFVRLITIFLDKTYKHVAVYIPNKVIRCRANNIMRTL